MTNGTLEILARIPSLAPVRLEGPVRLVGEAQPRASVPPEAAARPETSMPARRQPYRPVRFPAGSIAMLALIAAALWAAAAWQERVRFLRQQPPARWAEAFDGDTAGPRGMGGVVR